MYFEDMKKLEPLLLGRRIRHAREKLEMSQEDFAASIGRDQRAVSEYEHGKRRVIAAELPLIARILHVPVMYFFEDELSAHDLDRALLEQFHRLPSQDAQRVVIDGTRVFADSLGDESGA